MLGYVEGVLRETREELAKADQKANTLLATAGVFAGLIAGALIQSRAGVSDFSSWVQWLFGLGVLSYVVGFGALISAIMPRTRYRGSSTLEYFGDIASYMGGQVDFEAAMLESANLATHRACSQLRAISNVVMTKYRLIRLSVVLFSAGLALFSAAWLLG